MGKKCGRCSTRYCGPECQVQHWKEGGHDQLCKKINRSGGAEQYHANNKYSEAVAVAVEKCADDTKGQTCFICTEGIKRRTGEGLVSEFCACRGGSSFAHVSCLAEQAKILWADAEENNLDIGARFQRWHTCNLCKQRYHSVVACALGWACWKTYVGRPEADQARRFAINLLGNGLAAANHNEDALTVQEAMLSMLRRLGDSEENLLVVKGNLASTYQALGRLEQALRLKLDLYSGSLRLHGEQHKGTVIAAYNYADCLVRLNRFEEAKSLLRKMIPVARRVFDESSEITLKMRWKYAEALCRDTAATLDDVREAVKTLEDTERTARRVLGGANPFVGMVEGTLRVSRELLSACESACDTGSESISEAFAAMTPSPRG